jgi:hypothetical protein
MEQTMQDRTTELKNVCDSFSGGSDGRYRHWFNRRFVFTEGVKAMADTAGAYWLLDKIAFEIAPDLIKAWDTEQATGAFLDFIVKDGQGDLVLQDGNDNVIKQFRVEFTDFPDGKWVFELALDGLIDPNQVVLVMLLLQEH